MLLRQDGRAGRYAADQRQQQAAQALHDLVAHVGQRSPRRGHAAARLLCLLDGTQGLGLEADAARSAADQLDRPLARQRLEVLFRGVCGFIAERGCDLGPGRRGAGAGDGVLNQLQDLLLARRELEVVSHKISGSLAGGRYGWPIQSGSGRGAYCELIQYLYF